MTATEPSARIGSSELYVEPWAPGYGTPFDQDDALAEPEKVDESVELDAALWEPVTGVDDGVERVAFVDGIRRIDAYLTVDEPSGPVPGICGSFGVGATVWDRTIPRSHIEHVRIDRIAVFGKGQIAAVPVAGPQLAYRSESVSDPDPSALIQRFHGLMRKAEAVLAEGLAQQGTFVVADGPINDLSATEKVGYIKTHRAPYLTELTAGIIGSLRAGMRTPMFLIGKGAAFPRYSWYQKLADMPGGHSWTGVVRAEVSSHLDMTTAVRVANRTAALLPLVASEAHVDGRAPQNLVPIGALERDLRRRLGDPAFIHRALRSAVTTRSRVADDGTTGVVR